MPLPAARRRERPHERRDPRYRPAGAGFDTHAAVKTLREAGADEGMAEAIVNTASAAAGADRDQLATKADIASLRAELGTVRWVVGIQSAITVATFAIVAAKLL